MLLASQRSQLFSFVIVAIAGTHTQVLAVTATPNPPAAATTSPAVDKTQVNVQAETVNPKTGAVRLPSNDYGPTRVRILLKLTPYETVNVRAPGGETITKQVPLQPVEHILRARLEQTNHFYFGQWHVETVPLRWQKATAQYAVQLNVYKRFAPHNEVEEKIGAIRVDGHLEEAGPKLYTLMGGSKQDIADPMGQRVLAVAAGTQTQPAAEPVAKPLVSNSGQVSEL